MSEKHTPGRLVVRDGYSIYTVDGTPVADTCVAASIPITDEANARLIAAAPELLAALKALLEDTQHADHPDCESGPCPVRDARAAIAKVEGGRSMSPLPQRLRQMADDTGCLPAQYTQEQLDQWRQEIDREAVELWIIVACLVTLVLIVLGVMTGVV